MKPISKSKRQLAQLLIEAGVTQFPKGANWAAQDKCCKVFFYSNFPERCEYEWYSMSVIRTSVRLSVKIPNWHQTVLSRDEFDQIVAAEKLPKHVNCCCVTRPITEPATTPTLDQLLQDWRNADDYAQRKQIEADEAAAMRDERWQAAQARAGEMRVTVGRCESVVGEPVPVIPVTTGKFRNANLGRPERYIPGNDWDDEICDECGKLFRQHWGVKCRP